jgi:hypothetical protein
MPVLSKTQPLVSRDYSETQAYYLFRVYSLMPILIDIESKKKTLMFPQRLRPELATDKHTIPLSNGAFASNSQTLESDTDDITVASVGLKLKREIVPKLIESLENLECLPVDSAQISQLLHSRGVNIKFLGQIAE